MGYREANHPFIYGSVHLAVGIYEQIAHEMVVIGREKVPKLGGAVLAITHRSGYDPIPAAIACPRPVFFMAKKELWEDEYRFKIPMIKQQLTAGAVAEIFNTFLVDRGNMQLSTLKKAISIIKKGKVVGIFPEMTRYEDEENKIVRGLELGYLNLGVAAIASSHEAPIIPMGLSVTKERNSKGKERITKIAAVIKEPVAPVSEPDLPKKIAYQQTMENLRPILQEAHYDAYDLAA